MGRKFMDKDKAMNMFNDIEQYVLSRFKNLQNKYSGKRFNFIDVKTGYEECDFCYNQFDYEEKMKIRYQPFLNRRFNYNVFYERGMPVNYCVELHVTIEDMVYHKKEVNCAKENDKEIGDTCALRPVPSQYYKESWCYDLIRNSKETKEYFKDLKMIVYDTNEYIRNKYRAKILILGGIDIDSNLTIYRKDTKGRPEQYYEYFMDQAILAHERKAKMSSVDRVAKYAKDYGVELEFNEEKAIKYMREQKNKGYEIGTTTPIRDAKIQEARKEVEGLTKEKIRRKNAEFLYGDNGLATKRKDQKNKDELNKQKKQKKTFFSGIKAFFKKLVKELKWKFRKKYRSLDSDLDYQQKMEKREKKKYNYGTTKTGSNFSLSLDFDFSSFLWILIPAVVLIVLAVLSSCNQVVPLLEGTQNWFFARLENMQCFYIAKFVIEYLFHGNFMQEIAIFFRLLLYVIFGALIVVGGIIDIVLIIIYGVLMAILFFVVSWLFGNLFVIFAPGALFIFVIVRMIKSFINGENGVLSIIVALLSLASVTVYYSFFIPAYCY